jgi:hypothetical protein
MTRTLVMISAGVVLLGAIVTMHCLETLVAQE